jgi:uncharacterized protein YjiK/methionine-rich copper-binding protein CopC
MNAVIGFSKAGVLAATLSAALLAACGGGGDSTSSTTPGTALSAPPTLSFTAPQESIDLNNYTLVGKYSLPVASSGNLLASEVSAITYNADTDTLFVLGDSSTSITQISKTGALIDTMNLPLDATRPQGTYYYDLEGLAYAGGGKFVFAEERLRQVTQFSYTAGTTLNPTSAQTVKLGTTTGNIGFEGISYDPVTSGYILVKEKTPLGIFQTGINFTTSVATNGSATAENSVNLFDPALAGGVLDFGDVFAFANSVPATAADYSHLIVLSQESGKILKMDRAGKTYSTLDIDVTAQHEGITFDKQLNMYITNELGTGGTGEEMWVYTPTRSKTAVGLGSNLYLSFGANVSAGTGTLTLSNGAGDVRTIAVSDANQVIVDGKTVIINPAANLLPGATYSVQYAAGVFKDATGLAAPAVSNATALGFTTVSDITIPRLVSSTPADNAISVNLGTGTSRITLNFDETVMAGSGTVTVSNGTDDVRTFAASDAQVSFTGSAMAINLSTELRKGTAYYVLLSHSAVTDVAGNRFVGISSPSVLNFTTVPDAVPTVLAAGDLLFIAANADAVDAIAFVLTRAVNTGTSVFFSDRDSLVATNEAAFQWVADQAYPAGTVVTIQTDSTPPVANRGSTVGLGGGISGTSETYFAFQGSIDNLTASTAGTLTVATYIAAINVAGAAGPFDATLQAALNAAGAFISFTLDNVKFNASLDSSDIPALRARIANTANWSTSDTVAFPITGGSLFP